MDTTLLVFLLCASFVCSSEAASLPTCRRSSGADLVDLRATQGQMYLQVYEADNVNGAIGPILRDGDRFCPETYVNGFSLLCKGMADTTSFVQFSVNGRAGRTERLAPYTIASDVSGVFLPWTSYPRLRAGAPIGCETDEGDSVVVHLIFKCDETDTTQAPVVTSTEISSPTTEITVATEPVGSPGMYLQVIQGNVDNPAEGPVLSDGGSYCPSIFSTGFSIYCKGVDPSASYVDFFVDGALFHRESAAPYAINMNFGTKAVAWDDYPTSPAGAVLRCETNSNEFVQIRVTFECSGPTSSPPTAAPPTTAPPTVPATTVATTAPGPTPASMYFQVVQANVDDGAYGPILSTGDTFCPDTFPTGFSVYCQNAPSTTGTVEFFVDDVLVHTEGGAPYAIAMNFGTKAVGWDDYPRLVSTEIKCLTNEGVSAAITVTFACPGWTLPPPTTTSLPFTGPTTSTTTRAPGSTTCSTIDARSPPSDTLADDWTEVSTGIVYKEGGDATVDRFPEFSESEKIIEYEFTPTSTSKYAIVMESTTISGHDYNDVWVRMPLLGIIRQKNMGEEAASRRFLKVYQSSRSRKWQARTIDNYGASLVTPQLTAGQTYIFQLAGRSKRIIVHGFGFFPCYGFECEEASRYFKDLTATCVV